MQDLSKLVGMEIAGYRLERMLGEGGMACVFEGVNVLTPTIRRAVKIMKPEWSQRTEFVQRFAEEASVLAQLRHFNILEFYEVKIESGMCIMILEFLKGKPLSAHLKTESGELQPWNVVADWLKQGCEGVSIAHLPPLGAGYTTLVHRDLKPDNFFLTNAGLVKVLDFGIARAVDEADRMNKATMAGNVPGSPGYMAPEICNGAEPTPAADVYAMGMTAYELLLGHHPFMPPDKPNPTTTQLMMAQVQNELPPVNQVRPDVPVRFAAVIARALQKDPAMRFQNARELADALIGVISTEVPAAAAGPGQQRSDTFVDLSALGRINPTPQTGAMAIGTPGTSTALQPQRKKSMAWLWILIALLVLGAAGAGAYFTGNLDSVLISAGLKPEPPPPPPPPPPPLNEWVTIASPRSPKNLGLARDFVKANPKAIGWRPELGVKSPDTPFQIQRHEVTWAELDKWMAENPDIKFEPGERVPPAKEIRKKRPVSGIPWSVARDYCKSIGGDLPTEAQWEYAARGPNLRRFPWGDEAVDFNRTNSFAGDAATAWPIESSDQDRTPATDGKQIFDMMGNVREWTRDVWRADEPGDTSVWQQGDVSFRSVRGFPLRADTPDTQMAEGAAYRSYLYATGDAANNEKVVGLRKDVGFRCVRAVPTEELAKLNEK